jgi:hypothetical protein
MKKRVTLAVFFGLILALFTEAILTLLQALQERRLLFRGPRRPWIALPLAAAHPTPLPVPRATTAVQGSRSSVSQLRHSNHPHPIKPRAYPRQHRRASAGS